MYIDILLEDMFQNYHGHDLFDRDKMQEIARRFKVKKADTISLFIETLSEALVSRHKDRRL